MADFILKQHDTWPPIRAVLSDAVAPIDLTGASVKLLLKTIGAAPALVRTCTIVGDPADGRVEYQWIAADTVDVNSYKAEYEITFGDGRIATIPNSSYFAVDVVADLGP